jgi:hypothetical protein
MSIETLPSINDNNVTGTPRELEPARWVVALERERRTSASSSTVGESA